MGHTYFVYYDYDRATAEFNDSSIFYAHTNFVKSYPALAYDWNLIEEGAGLLREGGLRPRHRHRRGISEIVPGHYDRQKLPSSGL